MLKMNFCIHCPSHWQGLGRASFNLITEIQPEEGALSYMLYNDMIGFNFVASFPDLLYRLGFIPQMVGVEQKNLLLHEMNSSAAMLPANSIRSGSMSTCRLFKQTKSDYVADVCIWLHCSIDSCLILKLELSTHEVGVQGWRIEAEIIIWHTFPPKYWIAAMLGIEIAATLWW